MRVAKLSLRLGALALMGVTAHTHWSTKSNHSVQAHYKGASNPLEPFFNHRWNTNWDRRDPKGYIEPLKGESSRDIHEYSEKIRNLTPTATRHLMLVRHGQYHETAATDHERCLTKLGRAQADQTGQRLRQLSLPYKNITSSTMARAHETARIIQDHVPHLEVLSDPGLSEGAPAYPDPASGNWKPTPDQFFQDGSRIENAFRKYFHRADPEQTDDSYELIVCHSNVIRYFVCRALQFPLEGWIRVSVANCSMTLVTIHPDGTVVMEMMGDHGHIPPENVSFH